MVTTLLFKLIKLSCCIMVLCVLVLIALLSLGFKTQVKHWSFCFWFWSLCLSTFNFHSHDWVFYILLCSSFNLHHQWSCSTIPSISIVVGYVLIITTNHGFLISSSWLICHFKLWTCTFWLKAKCLNDTCIFWLINLTIMVYLIKYT